MANGPKYQIDWKFYGISLVVLAIITLTFYLAKRDVEIHEGKDVQRMLDVSNLDSEEQWRRQARNYVSNLARNRELTSDQREKAIDIYAEAMRERMKLWINGRIDPESVDETLRKQSESWQKYDRQFEQMLQEE